MVSRCLGGDVSTEFASKEVSHNRCALLIDFFDAGATVDLSNLVQFFIMVDDRHGGLLINAFGEY